MHLMIDLETLSTSPNAVVLSLGAVVFDKQTIQHTEHIVFDAQEQIERYRRHVSTRTVAWWADQSTEAKQVLAPEHGLAMRGGLRLLDTLLSPQDWDNVQVWANGASFDIPILHTMYECLHRQAPWKFYNERCYRTMKNVYAGVPKPQNGVAHNAKDDALNQALHLQAMWAAQDAVK